MLDLDMPIMNGFEACMRIKQAEGNGGAAEDLQKIFQIDNKNKINSGSGGDGEDGRESGKEVFIIAISALITESIKEKIKASGFDDFSNFP